MSSLSLRQSGGANIVSIPKKILQMLNLHTGDELDIHVEDSKIILTPRVEELSLEQMLAESPKSSFKLLDEDKEWMYDKPKGKEFWKNTFQDAFRFARSDGIFSIPGTYWTSKNGLQFFLVLWR